MSKRYLGNLLHSVEKMAEVINYPIKMLIEQISFQNVILFL